MKDKLLKNRKKRDLVEELERRNFQYGELSNKFADLQETYNIAMEEIAKLRGVKSTQDAPKEHITSFITGAVKRLEPDCTVEDLKEINSKVCEVWRKYHPISEAWNDTEAEQDEPEDVADIFMRKVRDFLKEHKMDGIHQHIDDDYVSIGYRKSKFVSQNKSVTGGENEL